MIEVTSSTDGLASAYQITEVTGGGSPVLETGGNLLIGIITLPHSEILPLTPVPPESSVNEKDLSPHTHLASEMSENQLFRQLVERGLSDLEQGRYKEIVKEKMTSGAI
jgi:hypothetical protein